MNRLMLKSHAADALDLILAKDDAAYARLNQSELCFHIQDQHPTIEKELAFALSADWEEIKNFESYNVFRRLYLHLVRILRDRKGAVGIPKHVLESIVDSMLPDIIAFFETEEGRHEFEEWKTERYRAEIVHHYDALIDENNDPVHDPEPLKKHMDGWDGDVFIDALKLTDDKSVLEIGVGTGRLAVKTAPMCKSFCGIDLSPKTIARAKENLSEYKNVNLICDDFQIFEFDQTFDTIYSSLTFMHIKEKESAIKKVAKLLTENGRFVLSIEKSHATILQYGKRKIKIYPDRPDIISKYIEAAGFKKIEQKETEFAYIIIAEKA